MTIVNILCIALGVVGICSTLFSLYADKERKGKVEALRRSVQRKSSIIEALEQENKFLESAAGSYTNWLDNLLETPRQGIPDGLLDEQN